MKTINELKELTNQIDKIMNEFEKIFAEDLHDISSAEENSSETKTGNIITGDNGCTAKSQ